MRKTLQTRKPDGEYKGHKIFLDEVGDDDCSKCWHEIVLPNGDSLVGQITPYDWSLEVVHLWIDAGYPGYNTHGNVGNWDKESLTRFLEQHNSGG